MRFKYSNGVYSVVLSKNFSATQPLHLVKYWLNDDYDNHVTLPVAGFDYTWMASLLFPGAPNGAQILHYMFQEQGGLWSVAHAHHFHNQSNGDISSVRYWFDDDYDHQTTLSLNGSNVNWITNLNITNLLQGVHKLIYQFKTQGEQWSCAQSHLFYKGSVTNEPISAYRYWINQNYADAVTTTIAPTTDYFLNVTINPGQFSCDTIDTLNIQFRYLSGVWSSVHSSQFAKPTDGQCYTAGCVNWQGNPPIDSTVKAIADYLCNQQIILNTQSAVTNAGPIMRHDLSKIVFKGLFGNNPGVLPSDHFSSPFYDMQNPSNYYYQFVKALSFLEYGDGISPFSRSFAHFRPSEHISRKDAFKVFSEAWNLPRDSSMPSPFTDMSNSDPMYAFAKALYNAGILNGGSIQPNSNLLRNDAFRILYDMLMTLTKPVPQTQDFYSPHNITSFNMNRIPGIDEGNFSNYTKTSFQIPGLMPLDFEHNFNSFNVDIPDEYFTRSTLVNGKIYDQRPLGNGWGHNYNSYIVPIFGDSSGVTSDDRILVHWGNGTNELYKIPAQSGQFYIPENEGNYNKLVVQGGQFVLTTKSQMRFYFTTTINNTFIAPLIKIKDRNNNEINISYSYVNDVPRVSSVTDPSGRSLNFFYNNALFPLRLTGVQAATGSINRSISFNYNNKGQLIQFTDPKGNSTHYVYDTIPGQTDLLTKIILPKVNTMTNSYVNRKLASTQTNGNTITTISPNYQYYQGQASTTSNIVTVRDGQSLSMQVERNRYGAVTKQHGMGKDVQLTYNNLANKLLPSGVLNNLNNLSTQNTYDSVGNLTKVKLSSGTQSITNEFTYNATNDLLTHKDGKGYITQYTYDANGNVSEIQRPIGTTQLTYNLNGTTASVKNPSNISTAFTYNTFGNMNSQSLGPINRQYTYDDASRLVSVTDPNGIVTNMVYDANDQLLQTVRDAGGLNNTTHFAFDANDNMTHVTNPMGGVTTLSYDSLDLLIEQAFAGDSKKYRYNEDGTMKQFKNQNSDSFYYSYIPSGLLVNDDYTQTTYNTDNTVARYTRSGKELSFGYDAFRRVSQITYNDFPNNTIGYQYDKNNNMVQMNYPNNLLKLKYEYDANNRLTAIKNAVSNISYISYSYHPDGRINQQTNGNGTYITYTYDAIGRLTGLSNFKSSGQVIASYTFTLDNNGNHTSESENIPNGLPMPVLDTATIQGIYANNHIQQYGNTTYTRDANGNLLTTSDSVGYTYDTHDNLIGYTKGGNTISYEYDPIEARRRRNNTRYVLDPLHNNNVLMEADLAGNPIAFYVHGIGLVCRINAQNGAISYFHYDFRGSTVALTNASQTVTHRYLYGAFGEGYAAQENGFSNPFRYVGAYGVMQEDSNLYFMRVRYCDAHLGRFISEDPIWNTNLFVYCENNPIVMIDPEGELGIRSNNNLQNSIDDLDNMRVGGSGYFKESLDGKDLYNSLTGKFKGYKKCKEDAFFGFDATSFYNSLSAIANPTKHQGSPASLEGNLASIIQSEIKSSIFDKKGIAKILNNLDKARIVRKITKKVRNAWGKSYGDGTSRIDILKILDNNLATPDCGN